MRQAGILAAGIAYALKHHVERLEEDHRHAERLQIGLKKIQELSVENAHTNMLYIELESREKGMQLGEYLKQNGILVSAGKRIRLVTHLDIESNDVEQMLRRCEQFFSK